LHTEFVLAARVIYADEFGESGRVAGGSVIVLSSIGFNNVTRDETGGIRWVSRDNCQIAD
jgi:hypothetical protein